MQISEKSWPSFIASIQPYFYGCFNHYGDDNQSNTQSLYSCENSTKLISMHRVVDGIFDCHLKDDEFAWELSCSLNNTDRFTCPSEPGCRAPIFPPCIDRFSSLVNIDEIWFRQLCDRIPDALPMIVDGHNHTDETDC